MIYQVPGGMLSNLLSQLTEQGLQDKYEDVLARSTKSSRRFGLPATCYATFSNGRYTALMNVISGERYKWCPVKSRITSEGFTEKLQYRSVGKSKNSSWVKTVVTVRPADLIAPQLPEFRKEIAEYAKTEEDVLMYALFPKQAKRFSWAQKTIYDVPLQTVEVKIDFSA